MKATILSAAKRFEIIEAPIPEIGETEVLLRVLVCGVCSSEHEPWAKGRELGKRMGHEAVCVVEKTGCRVTKWKPGDRVTGLIFEAFAGYTKADQDALLKVPDPLTDQEAIAEPLSCVLSGINRLDVRAGATAGVVGAGYMGALVIQMLQLKGASKIVVVDVLVQPRELARRFGASESYHPDAVPSKYIVDEWNDGIFHKGLDVVAEVTGNNAGLTLAGRMTAVHGILSIVGYHQYAPCIVDMELWNWKAIQVLNAHERRAGHHMRYMMDALNLVMAGRLDTASLATHEYGLDELNRAFQDLKEKPDGYVKGYIRISDR